MILQPNIRKFNIWSYDSKTFTSKVGCVYYRRVFDELFTGLRGPIIDTKTYLTVSF